MINGKLHQCKSDWQSVDIVIIISENLTRAAGFGSGEFSWKT